MAHTQTIQFLYSRTLLSISMLANILELFNSPFSGEEGVLFLSPTSESTVCVRAACDISDYGDYDTQRHVPLCVDYDQTICYWSSGY